MSFDLTNIADFTPVTQETFANGLVVHFRFDNGYGASLINHDYSHGVELAVLKFEEDGTWDLDYNTPITGDVIPHLADAYEVMELLTEIRDLPAHTPEITA